MPLPVISNVYRVTWNWAYTSGQTAANVLHFHDDTAGTHNEAHLSTNMNTNANSNLFYGVASAASVTSIDIIKLDGTSPQQTFTPATPLNWDGGIGGSAMPAVAGLVSLRTAMRGPRGRGRIYLPFWSEQEAADGFWQNAADRTACQTAWGVFINAMKAAGWSLQVTSYAHSSTQDVTSHVVPSALATQRRRQRRLQ